MYKIGDQIIPDNTPFEHEEVQYPANWALLATQEEKASIGLVEYIQEVPREQAIASAWDDIKAVRDSRQLDGGVQVGGHWFLSTERATGEYNSMINVSQGVAADTVLRHGWRTMDGAEVDMTPALARQILLAGIAQRSAIDDAAQAHRIAMEGSADPSAYDFSGDWPKVFGEV